MNILDKIFGDPNKKVVKLLQPAVDSINAFEEKFKAMSDIKLREMTDKFKKQLNVDKSINARERDIEAEKKKLDEILPEVFAVVREAARRVLKQRHYDVQLMGGIILHRGQISEMKTGEGKTLVATLPAYLNALTGRGVHLITVNDYLAKRDAEWMGQLYSFLGLTVGCINHDISYKLEKNEQESSLVEVERKEAYLCDVLYGTNNEYGFDYLRDNMAHGLERMSQRDLNYAIVDEVDSILIDEARTPLIISAPAEESTEKYFKFNELVRRLKENEDYNIDEKMRAATLTEGGISRLEKMLNVDNIYTSGGMRDVHHIEQALKAMALFKRDRDYVVKDGEVVIVDEFTGRLMFGRRYSEGLHQAIEARENVKVQRESQTLASVTFQNYFRMYEKLAGMTGTAVTEAEEFAKIYSLETIVVPTNKEMSRKDLNDLIYRSEMGKFKAVVVETKKRYEKGQPVLIGTISIEKNELLADMMEREGVKAQVLNAKHHEKEAQIIAQAGKLGAVTIATNMAGRGVDIILGGNPSDAKTQEEVKNLGGLHIIGTERHESRRIDNQLRGRAGRQGDAGSSQFYVSMEDDLMRIFGGEKMKGLMQTLKVPEDMPIENKMVSRSIESAQAKVEANNFDIRKHLVEYDDVINKHREAIYKRRREILEIADKDKSEKIKEEKKKLADIILEMVENEIEQVVLFHTSAEQVVDWNLEEIYQVASTIFPVESKLKDDLSSYTKNGNKLDKVKARTAIIEHLSGLALKNYEKLKQMAEKSEIIWTDIEKAILLRSIDTLWMEHLDSMEHMRKGIGLRGYGQRDPLVEYKKESYRLFNELNGLIQKQVVYSIFKVGDVKQVVAPTSEKRATQFSAPAKEMSDNSSSFSQFKTSGNNSSSSSFLQVKDKVKDEAGNKIGRNDPCPCGSGKKYKKCCGK